MGRKLESIKPLDAVKEAKEVDYDKDSYSYLFDEEEILGADKILSELEAIDDDRVALDAAKQPSNGIAKALAESEEKELWTATDLGKYTIGTPTQAKQAVQSQDMQMEPVSELEFQEISDDVDREDAEMQKKFEQIAEELEGIF